PFYATPGFPIARLLDKRRRTAILAGVIAIWSGMTALCGAAASFAQLFLFRVGVGIGEAGAGPASHSLIGDYFRKADRPTAIGFFSLGVPIGIFLGIYVGGLLVDSIGWRWTFVALGAPGILLALLVLATIREPTRGALDDPADAAVRNVGDVPQLEGVKPMSGRPTLRVLSYSGGRWPRCAAERDRRAFLTWPGATMVLFAVAMVFALWTSSVAVVYASIFVAAFAQFYLMGPYFAVVQRLAPLRGRAVATAFFFFILSLAG